ncbi:molecular chaperone GrpE [Gallibacterium salpingitidis]|uniref:Protein GrpE n=1 Tax=Gallibacterium salpingitidis TaxID=505341 RepID=A0AB36E164_9PAST|nr:nucleotide exchange factor GrpE [Gallibacterium salpingitidis]OBX09083.1 molecular chaperone GrpE [Gallibacterium salpingitidis]OBX09651.1 molecular chaperone GrpE [Gallibacterium salpingitidis]WKT00815.1 nucleotide exchange factor GrpE [Gallibacterium salpingitidis]
MSEQQTTTEEKVLNKEELNEQVAENEEVETASEEIDPLNEALAKIQDLEAQLEEAAKKEQDILLRTRAEIDNIRRRTEADVEKAHKFGLEKFAKEILNVIDNLERAAATPNNSEDESVKALFDGVELTLKDLISTVAKFGIEPVGVVGETFNPDLHQAISMQPTEGFTTNQITTVLQKGYLLNGRVIRPAMVMIAA